MKRRREFEFSFQPSLRREQMESLHELGFVERRGRRLPRTAGVGKTHLAISLRLPPPRVGVACTTAPSRI